MTSHSVSTHHIALLLLVSIFAAPAFGTNPAPTAHQARFEIRFMEDMIDHHAMAVMMGEMCLDRAVHPELGGLCQNIIASQTAEIQHMQTWLLSWYGISYAPKTSRAGMNQLEALTGAEFEIEFMKMMSRHHTEAIEEATECLMKAYHKELRALCENIVKAQASEINQMRTWLCEWYGVCDALRG
ncbi:MAG: DUF305 domain-containing protein [Acidobacteriota bacterium]